MFCSGCGHALAQGQTVCPQCGRPVAAAPPPAVPNLAFEVANYANRVRALSTVWFIYGGLSLVLGIVGLAFANSFLNGGGFWMHGPWAHGNFPFGPGFGSAIIHFAWVMVVLRSGLALCGRVGTDGTCSLGSRGGDCCSVPEHPQDPAGHRACDLDARDVARVSEHVALRSALEIQER